MNLGFGIGLRHKHYEEILENKPAIDWLEIISDNYISAHCGYFDFLAKIRETYPIIMHGVSLSIGSSDPLNLEYLAKLKKLANFLEVPYISDHLCFTGINGLNSHDLLPIPYTQEALDYIIPRINYVQNFMQKPLALENASSYFQFEESEISEAEFLNYLHQKTGVKILLDVNNVYVSCFNHNWNAEKYIDQINADAIIQYHLAGYSDKETYLLDSHDAKISNPVWDLYKYTIKTKGQKSCMIEWDENIPELSVMLEELEKIKSLNALHLREELDYIKATK